MGDPILNAKYTEEMNLFKITQNVPNGQWKKHKFAGAFCNINPACNTCITEVITKCYL